MDEIPNLSESLRDIASYHSRVADMCYGEISVTEDHFASVAHRAAELLERYQWIPVSERLPKEGEQVFVFHQELGLGESDALKDGEFWSRPRPTHWLAIPPLPETQAE